MPQNKKSIAKVLNQKVARLPKYFAFFLLLHLLFQMG